MTQYTQLDSLPVNIPHADYRQSRPDYERPKQLFRTCSKLVHLEYVVLVDTLTCLNLDSILVEGYTLGGRPFAGIYTALEVNRGYCNRLLTPET